MTDRILLTGATGFIGRHLARRLAADGLSLRALVRPTSDTAELQSLDVELAEGDVTDWGSVCTAIDGCQRVVHLANIYSMWEPDPSVYRQINVEGTRRVAQAAAEAGDPAADEADWLADQVEELLVRAAVSAAW